MLYEVITQWPYYFKDVPVEKWSGDLLVLRLRQTAPAFKVGETILARDPADMQKGRQAWQYLFKITVIIYYLISF